MNETPDWYVFELINNILRYPNFRESLIHKVFELRELQKHSHMEYEPFKDKIKSSSLLESIDGLDFSLIKIDESWIPDKDTPKIPQFLIDKIVEISKTHVGVLKQIVKLAEGESFEISFMRGQERISGSISVKIPVKKSIPIKSAPLTNIEKQKLSYLIDLLIYNPTLREFVLNEMDNQWAPMIENKVLKAD